MSKVTNYEESEKVRGLLREKPDSNLQLIYDKWVEEYRSRPKRSITQSSFWKK